jgi:hypothetical protein
VPVPSSLREAKIPRLPAVLRNQVPSAPLPVQNAGSPNVSDLQIAIQLGTPRTKLQPPRRIREHSSQLDEAPDDSARRLNIIAKD